MRINNVSPLLIESADFSHKLRSITSNIEATERFLARGVSDYHLNGAPLPAGYRLVKSLCEDQYRIVTTHEGQPLTIYAVKLVHHNEITYPHPATTQVMVWRTRDRRHRPVYSDFPHRFFMHILDTSNIVVSDSEQTGDGQRFWEDMLSWAFYEGYSLYVADGTEGEDWPKTQITDLKMMDEKWFDYVWGGDRDVHPHRRLIISKKPLEAA